MLDLERSERLVLIILILTLLAGAGVSIYRRTHSAVDVTIETFDVRPAVTSHAPAEKININSASAAEFTTLKGIGPVLAQRIVDYRAAHGRFFSMEDIKKVRGIGDVLYGKIQDYISLE